MSKDPKLEDNIDFSEYPNIKQEIDSYLKKYFEDNQSEIETIVAMCKKGIRIIDEFLFENPQFVRFKVLTDMDLEEKSKWIQNQKVLVCDDSIYTSNTILDVLPLILKHNPKEISILCLRINEEACKSIYKTFEVKDINSCKRFKTKEEQENSFGDWEMIFLDGLRRNINPDFPNLSLDVNSINIKKIMKLLIDFFNDKFDIESVEPIDSVSTGRESLCKTIILNSNHRLINDIYDIYASADMIIEQQKIRCYVIKNNSSSELIITPINDPQFNDISCNVYESYPEYCLFKVLKRKSKNEKICKLCIPWLLNQIFIMNIQDDVIKHFNKNGILISDPKIYYPKVKRYLKPS